MVLECCRLQLGSGKGAGERQLREGASQGWTWELDEVFPRKGLPELLPAGASGDQAEVAELEGEPLLHCGL